MKKIFDNSGLYLCSVVLCLSLSACNEEKEVDQWIGRAEDLKTAVLKERDAVPYRGPQNQAFKDYFVQVSGLPILIQKNGKVGEALNRVLMKRDLAQVCERSLLSKVDWDSIMSNCTRNSFFLCSADVKSYPDSIKAIYDGLTPELQELFQKTESCNSVIQILEMKHPE